MGLQGYDIQSVGIVMSCLFYVYICWCILSMLTKEYAKASWSLTLLIDAWWSMNVSMI